LYYRAKDLLFMVSLVKVFLIELEENSGKTLPKTEAPPARQF